MQSQRSRGLSKLVVAAALSIALVAPEAAQAGDPPPSKNVVTRLKNAFVKHVNKNSKGKKKTKNSKGSFGVRGYATTNGPKVDKPRKKEASTINKMKHKFRKWANDRPGAKKDTQRPKNGGSGVRGYTSRNETPTPSNGDYLCRAAVADGEVRIGVASVAALNAVRQLAKAGGIQDIPKIYRGEVGSAIAVILEGQRAIIYNPSFLDMLNNEDSAWIAYSVLAHELGHHANGHTFDGHADSWLQEMQADYYSGYVIGRLGGSQNDAKSALQAWAVVTSQTDSTALHPPVNERLNQVEKGWREGSAGAGSKSAPDAPKSAKQAPSVWGGDLEAAAQAKLDDPALTDVLERQGYENLREAGKLINKKYEGAARSLLFKAESVPNLSEVSKWWICRTYAIGNNPLRAEDCFKEYGIDPAGRGK